MNSFILNSSYATEGLSGQSKKFTKASIWQEAIDILTDPANEMDESKRKNYEQSIMQKMRTGKRLSSEELQYLRIHNPEMYKIAMRVEIARKSLKTQLANCKSKEEAQQVFSIRLEMLGAMKNDPAREYMASMVKKEMDDFRKSSAYARLPLTEDEGEREGKKVGSDLKEDIPEEDAFEKAMVYTRMQFQCDAIDRMAQGILSA